MNLKKITVILLGLFFLVPSVLYHLGSLPRYQMMIDIVQKVWLSTTKGQAILLMDLADAAESGSMATVEKLIAGGADVNKGRGGVGWTPLMAAATNGHTEIVKKLIESGADVNIQRYKGRNALLVEILSGHAAVVDELIAAGADVNKTDIFGNSPLIFALGHMANPIIVEKLLAAGADIFHKNNDGKSVFWNAQHSTGPNKEIIITLLKKAGATE